MAKKRGRELLQQLETLQAYSKQEKDSTSFYSLLSRMQCFPATALAQTARQNFILAQAMLTSS